MTPILDITLPFPDFKTLGSNSNAHWAKKSKATKAHRAMACVLCQKQVAKLDEVTANELLHDRFEVTLHVQEPDRRRRDADNILRASKAFLDGIFDSLPEGVDDAQIKRIVVEKHEPVKGGQIRVVVGTI